MLKWYDGNGRLQFIKAMNDGLYSNFPNAALMVDYAELTYDNDMVYLRDVFYNKTILKVRLDVMHRPLISWFDGFYHGFPMQDTTRMYYASSGKLDSIIRKYQFGSTTLPHLYLV
jgi:hypothetical protein